MSLSPSHLQPQALFSFAHSSSLSNCHQLSTLSSPQTPQTLFTAEPETAPAYGGSFSVSFRASFSGGSGGSEGGREILVQHLLVKEDDLKLLLEAWSFSGGFLKVPEFEEVAFSSPLNKVARVKTQFGWHLLQVLSERC